MLKKALRFIRSMKFAMILLSIMALACVAGSVLPQGEFSSYANSGYPQWLLGLIKALTLYDVFGSIWFIAPAGLLCLSLIACNLSRIGMLTKRYREGFTHKARLMEKHEPLCTTAVPPEKLFTALGFKAPKDGATYVVRNRIGIFGAWLCHLGFLIIILGFGFGGLFGFETSVYGRAGQTLAVEDTGYNVTIDDFTIDLREDDTVEQYTAALTVEDAATGEKQSAQASVNHPAALFGYKYYQNSTGFGASVSVIKDDQVIQNAFICAGESMHVEALNDLHVFLRAFYPNYAQDANGQGYTRSSALKNPAYLYMLYYGNDLLGMNVLMDGEVITVDDVTIALHDPQPYTLLEIKRDPLERIAMIGGLIVVIALLLCFYLQPKEYWAVQAEDGKWQIYGKCRIGAAALREDLTRTLRRLEGGKT